MARPHIREEGQSLVLVALMAVVLFAFVGLAIDGGNVYTQRRIAQNAADGASIRGAYVASDVDWRTNPTPSERRDEILREINTYAEAHGIPDTNGNPGDEINTNVTGTYVTERGIPITGCEVTTCVDEEALEDAWGVRLNVRLNFPTYFAGVIGLSQMTVNSQATGVTHAGARGNNEEYWASFATDKKNCGGIGYYENDIRGSNIDIGGNQHSNGHFRTTGATLIGSNSVLTYVEQPGGGTPCVDCPLAGIPGSVPSTRIGLVLPRFEQYYDFAYDTAMDGTTGAVFINGPHTVEANDDIFGVVPEEAAIPVPVTFVNGDLTITEGADPNSYAYLSGLIMVNGNIIIDAPYVDGYTFPTSLMATGNIVITEEVLDFQIFAFVDFNQRYSTLLQHESHDAAFFSNRDTSEVGQDSCTTPAIEIRSEGLSSVGAILAPRGRVKIDSSSPSQKTLNGTIIADTIEATGANFTILYNGFFFPAQPDFIELME